jgi:hypothetical protein
MSTPLVTAVVVALTLSACGDGGEWMRATPSDERSPSPAASPIGAGVEAPTATQACINGWLVPTDRDQRELPFHVIRRTMGVDGEFELEEMRYFEGPESPPSTKGYLQRVDRWYVKASLRSKPAFGGRWLIEERAFGSAVVAAAPFDSRGFVSPDWIGFQYEGEEAERVRYPGLPGKWAGLPYDFVTGRDLETGERVFSFPGLPPSVAGCLLGT